MSTTSTIGKVASVVWAGTFDKDLYHLITNFASVERTQLASLDRRRYLLNVCILKKLSKARFG